MKNKKLFFFFFYFIIILIMKNNNKDNFYWNKENNEKKQDNSKKTKKKNKKTLGDILREKLWPIAESYLKRTLKDSAMNKLQEAEVKVIESVDYRMNIYKNKIIVWILLLIGFVLVFYSFFEIFFKKIGFEEWTNFGAGIFFIFVALIIYFINSFNKKK